MLLLYPQPPLEKTVTSMRRMGEILMPYTYPLTPKSEAEDIACLKLNELMVDGYQIYIQYSKGNYGEYFLESVEILGKNAPFLPFVLVCKIAKVFLGEEHLAYVDFWHDNRRHYCWTLAKNEDDESMPGPYKVEMDHGEYEGLEYSVLPNGGINFH